MYNDWLNAPYTLVIQQFAETSPPFVSGQFSIAVQIVCWWNLMKSHDILIRVGSSPLPSSKLIDMV